MEPQRAERYGYRIELARRYFPHRGRLLDVGCGHGGWAHWIANAIPGLEPHGVDVVDACSYPISFATYDGTHLPFTDGQFDACVIFSVLHHTDHPERLVAEVSRVCRSGGRIIVVEDIASSRIQTTLTRIADFYENRLRSWWRALTGRARWGHTEVPLPYQFRSYPAWTAMFTANDLATLELASYPATVVEHGVFVLEKRSRCWL